MPAFTPTTPSSPGAFTPTPGNAGMRRVTFGDHPILNGSVAFNQMIAAAGFITPTASPVVGTFTPSS